MTYFKIFSIIMGLVTIGVRPLMHIFPEKWNKFELETAYTEKRPNWVWGVALIGLTIVCFTWYKQLTTDIPYSLILTLIITLTLIKTSQILFNYDNFRKFVHKALIEDRSILRKINIATTLLGLSLLYLGVFIY